MSRSHRSLILIIHILLLSSLTACETTSTDNNSSTSAATPDITATDDATTEPAASPPAQSANGAMTTEEIIGGLDAELDESIAVFDGMILDERSKAEAATAASYDNAGAGSDDPNEVLFEEGDLEEGLPGYGEFPETAEGNESESDASSEEGGEYAEASVDGDRAPAGTSASSGSIPEDIDDGSDDDIVARQIREAAQKEKDPVLKEKLWDEYRKYKNQQRGN